LCFEINLKKHLLMLNLTEANAPPYLAEITAALEENSDVELGSNDDLGIF
jgi:hypothetical protein